MQSNLDGCKRSKGWKYLSLNIEINNLKYSINFRFKFNITTNSKKNIAHILVSPGNVNYFDNEGTFVNNYLNYQI